MEDIAATDQSQSQSYSSNDTSSTAQQYEREARYGICEDFCPNANIGVFSLHKVFLKFKQFVCDRSPYLNDRRFIESRNGLDIAALQFHSSFFVVEFIRHIITCFI